MEGTEHHTCYGGRQQQGPLPGSKCDAKASQVKLAENILDNGMCDIVLLATTPVHATQVKTSKILSDQCRPLVLLSFSLADSFLMQWHKGR